MRLIRREYGISIASRCVKALGFNRLGATKDQIQTNITVCKRRYVF